ncbi:hypothetical protein ACUN0G_32740 [Pseudomonas sp. 32A]|uniref:hypothetical protein n=1 Tax=Pseudomonas sp. 32A TaxID=651185 RepID=UPI004045B6C0
MLVLLVMAMGGCAGVKVNTIDNRDYLSLRRGDVLTSGQLSAASRTALQVAGVEEKRCDEAPQDCREQVRNNTGLGEEQRLATLSELWLQEAQHAHSSLSAERRTDAFLESARYAYAYLFMTARTPGQRALEDRQSQVRDYYNFSVQQALSELFERYRGHPPKAEDDQGNFRLRAGRIVLLVVGLDNPVGPRTSRFNWPPSRLAARAPKLLVEAGALPSLLAS